MTENNKYTMRMSLEVLKHLGFNLYSNIPAVLSEVVANSWDADADKVEIKIEEDKITIQDDGRGMSLRDINEKFLLVGYQKRNDKDAGDLSPKYRRPVMGKKGIGKLSLFSIANNIEIQTIRGTDKNGFILNRDDIEREINTTEEYHPKDVSADSFDIKNGTRIIITQFKRNVHHTEVYLRKRLAKRFSVIGNKFQVIINDQPISIDDRDFYKNIQFLWLVGNKAESDFKDFKFAETNKLSGEVSVKEEKSKTETIETKYSISGWIGTVNKPGDLEQDTINNNKISIICRGKLWLEDILKTYNESGIYATYMIGEITADFLDIEGKEDIATSSRQSIKEDDPRYIGLSNHIYELIKEIKSVWVRMRNEDSKKTAFKKAKEFNPVLAEWFETLKTEKSKEHALDLFATIDTFHFDKHEEFEKKKILYVQGILAFEKLRLKENLDQLSKIKTIDHLHLSSIFSDMTDIEASMYYDIAEERVAIIREFKEKLDINEREKLIQKYLFDNLWLLNPSWERATEGTELMEQRVTKEFGKVIDSLTNDERKGRFDIKYRTAAGKHIIVELKRFHPSYKIDSHTLARQAEKYKSALKKCLDATNHVNYDIEVIIVLGETLEEDRKKVAERLRIEDARLIYYDELIEKSLLAYQEYLDREKDASKIRIMTNKILEYKES